MIVIKEAIDFLVSKESIFEDIITKYGLPPNWQRQKGFVTLCRLILEQQVSLESANTAYLKLKAFIKEISPEKIIHLTDEELRACYVSRQKASYLKNLSLAIIHKTIELDILEDFDNQEIRIKLTAIKGIGNWTASAYLLLSLQKPDIFPFGDVAAEKTLKSLKGLGNKAEIEETVNNWSPFKSTATFLLWHYYLSEKKRVIDYIFND